MLDTNSVGKDTTVKNEPDSLLVGMSPGSTSIIWNLKEVKNRTIIWFSNSTTL